MTFVPLEAFVRVHPRRLAEAIAQAADPPIPDEALDQLAAALSRGEGLARARGTMWVVLRDPWDADDPHALFRPTLLSFPRLVGNQRRIRTMRQVIGNLVTLGPLGKRPPDHETYAPASPFRARIALGGQSLSGADTTTTEHKGKQIIWYDLRHVPVGGLIYRVNDDGQVTLYQRVGEQAWVLAIMDGSSDIVPLPPLVEKFTLANGGNDLEGLEVLDPVQVWLRDPS